jgi:hypothetical protein
MILLGSARVIEGYGLAAWRGPHLSPHPPKLGAEVKHFLIEEVCSRVRELQEAAATIALDISSRNARV